MTRSRSSGRFRPPFGRFRPLDPRVLRGQLRRQLEQQADRQADHVGEVPSTARPGSSRGSGSRSRRRGSRHSPKRDVALASASARVRKATRGALDAAALLALARSDERRGHSGPRARGRRAAPEVLARLRLVGRLPEQRSVEDDVGVAADHQGSRRAAAGRALRRAFSSTDLGRDRPRSAPRRRGRRPRTRSPACSRISRRWGDREARTTAGFRPARGTRSPISRSADSSESEPWTMLKVTSSAKSPRIEPGRGLDRVGGADQLPRGRRPPRGPRGRRRPAGRR